MTTTTWPDIRGSLPPFHNHPDRACRNTPTAVFFPTGGGDNGQQARAICGTCPLRQDCLTWALPQPDLVGIWAGTTGKERARLRGTTWTVATFNAAGSRGARRKAANRRLRIVALSAEGLTAAEVANKVGCSTRTVDRHLAIARREAA